MVKFNFCRYCGGILKRIALSKLNQAFKYFKLAHRISRMRNFILFVSYSFVSLEGKAMRIKILGVDVNFWHPHLYLSSFERCLLLQAFASSLHLHLHVSCHFMCLVSLALDIRLNTLTFKFFTTSGTKFFAYGSLILLQLPLHLLVLVLKE